MDRIAFQLLLPAKEGCPMAILSGGVDLPLKRIVPASKMSAPALHGFLFGLKLRRRDDRFPHNCP